MDDNYQAWLWQKQGETCVKALKKHGFDAHIVSNIEEARKLILDMASGYETFGFGGSDTTRSIGILKELISMGKTVYDHWQKGLSKEDDLNIRLQQGRCDCFLCSANAISATGEVINVDGVGNRVNATTFGPKRVVIVAGMNKVRPDLESALARVKEVAAPMRAKSLNMETPCAETGVCNDCNVPQRICRVTTILHRKPMLTDVSVILIGQSLGF
ncbi:MAG: lactate utilization protein [Pseudomonadota bacterium]